MQIWVGGIWQIWLPLWSQYIVHWSRQFANIEINVWQKWNMFLYLSLKFELKLITVMISIYCALIPSTHLHPSAFVICFIVHPSNSEEGNIFIFLACYVLDIVFCVSEFQPKVCTRQTLRKVTVLYCAMCLILCFVFQNSDQIPQL